jgi:hypothetical protein
MPSWSCATAGLAALTVAVCVTVVVTVVVLVELLPQPASRARLANIGTTVTLRIIVVLQ